MKNLSSIGRIIFAVPFFIFGIIHFVSGGSMVDFVPNWLPFHIFWIYLVGLAFIAASISITFLKYARLACLLLALLLFIFILTVRLPALIAGNPYTLTVLLKDLSLMGAALVIAELVSRPEKI
jgi:uncharacterized membrane protein